MSFWHGVGRQLAHPHGWAGMLAGAVMRLANRAPNTLAIAALDLHAFDDVLELGFGPGEAIARIAARVTAGSVTGIDRSATMVGRARRRNARGIRWGRVRLELGDVAALPFVASSFDKIVAVNSAYFWRGEDHIVARVHRLLRPGGRLVIYVTDAATMRRWKFAGTGTHRLFDAECLRAMLIEGGFDARSVRIERHNLAGSITGLVAIAERPIPEADDRAPRTLLERT
ncbi:class I SAM-dependent methyltransferase [Sphingomonas oryzagri]